MRYWLKNAGTTENPLPANWYAGGADWRRECGEAAMFSRRPKVEAGDRFVFHAVGSTAKFKRGRIFAVYEATTDPEEGQHPRWPWQVETRMLVPGPRLPQCPTLDDIDVEVRSTRRQSHIQLTDDQGRRAVRLIAAAAERAGSLGRCYAGQPTVPPPKA
jgi:hypothetical protein